MVGFTEDMQYAGRHLLVEVWDASMNSLMDYEYAEDELKRAAIIAGATVLHSYMHPFGEGYGYSGVIVLAESHISIHTWPERGYAALDIFMCGNCNPEDTLPVLKSLFRGSKIETHMVFRGTL